MQTDWLVILVSLLGAYLAGSVPFGLLLARSKGINIREVGSGNIGATNVFRSVSKGLGLLTFLCDLLKGFLPSFIAKVWLQGMITDTGLTPIALGLLCGCAAVAGHNWPIFSGFKGGKGVATSAGVLLGIAPAAIGCGLAGWIVVLILSRYVSLASISASVFISGAAWWLYRDEGLLRPVALTIMGLLVIWRHRSNILRLIQGRENRFDFKKKKDSSGTEPAEETGDK